MQIPKSPHSNYETMRCVAMNRELIYNVEEIYYNTFISQRLCAERAFWAPVLEVLAVIRLLMLQREEHLGLITPLLEILNQRICEE